VTDSPRWCARCREWGDHHTDRCPHAAPATGYARAEEEIDRLRTGGAEDRAVAELAASCLDVIAHLEELQQHAPLPDPEAHLLDGMRAALAAWQAGG
jgi:hypothetical protein